VIQTIADLLLAFKDTECRQIEKSRLTHAPTIGEMYEGLTSSILNKAIPPDLGLQVVSGFFEGNRRLSGQIDCMLVSGAGSRVPHTRHFKWPVRRVVAVLEVKKRLSLSALTDAQAHLRDVLDIHRDDWLNTQDGNIKINIKPAMHAFQQIVGRVAPSHDRIEALPFDLEMIYRTSSWSSFPQSASLWPMAAMPPNSPSRRPSQD
jgi:hypothetical protein